FPSTSPSGLVPGRSRFLLLPPWRRAAERSRSAIFRSEFGWQPRLLAELVGCDPVELVVTLDWNGLGAVGVDGVISPFAEQTKAVLLQVLDQVTPFDGHSP